MVRVEFETLEQALTWIKDFPISKEYVGYYTKKQELIFVPLKSTRPTIYGYIKKADRNQVRNLLENKMKIYVINRFEWNAERDLAKNVDEEIEVKDYISEELKSKSHETVLIPGETVWKMPNIYIKKNVLEEMFMFYFNGVWHSTKVGKNLIRKYYPHVCQKTINSRLYNYSRYVTNKLRFRKETKLGRNGYEFRYTQTLHRRNKYKE